LLLLFSFLPPFSLATLHFLAFLSPTSCCPFWFLWISVFPPYSIFILVLPYVIPYRFKPLKFGLICWIHIAPYKTHACNPKKKGYQNTTHSSLCTHIPTSKFKPTEIWFCKWFSRQGYTTYENSELYWHYVILPSFIRPANQHQSAQLCHDKKCSHHQQQFSYRFAQSDHQKSFNDI
jgi:hypothetical protein